MNIVDTYRRILKAAEKGRGVRLSADEVFLLAHMDSAIAGAVEAEDEALMDERGAAADEPTGGDRP